MSSNVLIFVEGKEDKFFVDSYIHYLAPNRQKPEVQCSGGWTKIKSRGAICKKIEEELDEGARVLIIFDADEDYEERKLEIEEALQTHTSRGITSQNSDLDIFLFPNNQLPGEIEHLLEKIALPEHKKIFDCFDGYKACLEGKDESYQLPDMKVKIYCYKKALGIMKEEKENPFKPEYWDFQNPCLDPLKNFLLKNLS